MHPLALLLLTVLAGLLIVAIATDLRSRLIGNRLNGAVALLAPLWWLACGWHWDAVGAQILLAGVVLLLFAGCFALGMMGGGDVKLLAALALWLPPSLMMTMLLWMAVGGGVLTLVMLVRHRRRRGVGPVEVPYGVAIAGATIAVMANHILTNLPA